MTKQPTACINGSVPAESAGIGAPGDTKDSVPLACWATSNAVPQSSLTPEQFAGLEKLCLIDVDYLFDEIDWERVVGLK